jgi:hypothetical protein
MPSVYSGTSQLALRVVRTIAFMTAQTTHQDRAPLATIAVRLLRWVFVCALVAVMLYSPMSADARPHTPWPTTGQVRVYNPTGWQNTMRAAAEAWNRTGVTPTIVFTSRASDATVVVEASSRMLEQRCNEDYRCDGFAERDGHSGRITLPDADRDSDRHPSAGWVRLVAHELGHILGLPHETHDCALMNTDTGNRRCSPRMDFDNIRGPMRTDITAAERLYYPEVSRSQSAHGVRQTAACVRSDGESQAASSA